jgi:hypothetical protein
MKVNSDVEQWFAAKKHPQEEALRRIREIILDADPRMTEMVQYGTIQFVYESGLANFVQVSKKPVTLMFNVGARIPGRYPHLEGDGPNARFRRFADLAEVEARAAELRKIVAAGCAYKSPPNKR